jgi:hypothetical protein
VIPSELERKDLDVPLVLKLIVPVVAGALVAGVTLFGVVYAKTKAPDTNPASTPILTYGDES